VIYSCKIFFPDYWLLS